MKPIIFLLCSNEQSLNLSLPKIKHKLKALDLVLKIRITLKFHGFSEEILNKTF